MTHFSNEYGECDISPMPGCGRIAISNAVQIFPEYRGKGHGRENHKLRIDRMKSMGYQVAIATVVSTNLAEKRILEHENWTKVFEFVSAKTGNTVEFWYLVLNKG